MKKFILFALCLTFLASASMFMVGCKNDNKHTHSFTVETVANKYLSSAATCTQKAKYFYSCKCGEKGTETFEYGDALGHSFTHYESNHDATCTEDGTKTATCDRCDETDTITDTGSKLGHTYDKQVATDEYLCSKATCTEKAKYYYSCKCGEKGTETFEYGDTLGHSFTNYVSDNNATCTENGTKTAKCDRCDETDTVTDVGSKLGHSFTHYLSDNNATYEKDGTKTAHCDHKGCTATDTIIDEDSKLESYMAFKTLSVNGDKVYGKVSNDTKSFSFINEIETVGLIKYVVSLDVYGSQQVATKTIPLNVGDNTVYVIEMLDGEPQAEYEVTIRRRPMYTVSFDTSNGTEIPDQQIEEDFCATMPESAERRGYAFVKWNYDFSTPITKNTTIDANWDIITYKIFYNLNGGTVEGENPTSYTVEDKITLVNIPTKRGYNFATWDNGGKIEKGSIGDKTFNASYTPIVYKITYDCGSGTNNSLNPLEYTIESETIVLSDAYYINADFIEWRQNGVKVTEIAKGSIGSMTLTAVWDEYDVKLQVDGDCYTIIGLNCDKTEIVIKSTYKGKKVTAIGDEAFMWCSGLISVTVPSSVTSIGDHVFYGCSGLTNVIIGNSVTTIGNFAFYGCSGLTSIVIPNSVTSIGQQAFFNCSGLTSINVLSENTKYYSENDCLIETSTNTLILGCVNSIIPYGITTIGYAAFYNCIGLTSITIPESVISIGYQAFYGCSGLTSINVDSGNTKYHSENNCLIETSTNTLILGCVNSVIPYGITTIGYAAFYECSNLIEIIIPESVISIDSYAFYGCSNLTSITIPDSVTSIGGAAFLGTAWYNNQLDGLVYIRKVVCGYKGTMPDDTTIIIKDGTLAIAVAAFSNCSGLKRIVIPNSVMSIGQQAFFNCSNLTSITIPDSVTSIGDFAFAACGRLTSINVSNGNTRYYSENNCLIETSTNTLILGCVNSVIPYGVTTIGDYAFAYCGELTSVKIPNSVIIIGNFAFYNCSGLKSVTIGDSVTSIGDSAFSGCSGLTSVKYLGTIDQWVEINFGNRSSNPLYYAKKLYINNELVTKVNLTTATKISAFAFYNCSRLMSITIGDGVTSIGDSAFSGCSGLMSVTIGSGVTTIGDSAFSNCYNLTSITIPDNVTTIGDNSFAFSGLTSINVSLGNTKYYSENNCLIEISTNTLILGCANSIIPYGITTIGNGAFSYCSGLTSITIPNSVTTIGYRAFYWCDNLTSITIPNSVTLIDDFAFYGCRGLTSIIIANSVTSIGDYVFADCSELKTVYYKGTAEEWDKILIYSNNTYLTSATRYYYSETEPALNSDGTAYKGNYWHYDTDGKTPVIWKKEN